MAESECLAGDAVGALGGDRPTIGLDLAARGIGQAELERGVAL